MTEILISPYSRQLQNGGKNPKNFPFFPELIDLLKKNIDCKIIQVGVGNETKFENADEYFFDKKLKELKEKILDSAFWISVDNMMGHLGAALNKKGVVIWGKSDPEIFGYPQNLNILKSRSFLREQQYWLWSQTEYDENVFLPAKDILDIILDSGIAEQKKTSFSVVIPTYNKIELLKPCLESIFKHTDPDKDLEVIVVSNGCKDGSVEYLKSLDQNIVKVLEYPEPLGYTCATNIGAKAATGEYVVFLNNDTEILGRINGKDWIDCLYEPFTKDSLIGETGVKELYQLGIRFLVGFCVMFKKTILEKINFFDPIFNPGWGEDHDASQKIQDLGLKIKACEVNINHIGECTVWQDRDPWEENVQKNIKILQERYPHMQPDPTRVHCVVPTYRRHSQLKHLLSLIENQTYRDFIVHVVADGDDEEVRKIVSDFGEKFVYTFTEPDRNFGSQPRISVLEMLPSNEMVCFIDDDNEIENNYLERLVSGFKDGVVLSMCQINHNLVGIIPQKNEIEFGRIDSLNFMVRTEIAKCHLDEWVQRGAIISHDFLFISACARDGGRAFIPEVLGTHGSKFDMEALRRQDDYIAYEIFDANFYHVEREDIVGKSVCDIGAARGYFSILAHQYGAAEIFSIEANPNTFTALQENTKTIPNIHCIHGVALSHGFKAPRVAFNASLSATDAKCYVTSQEEGEGLKTYSLRDLVGMVDKDSDCVCKIDAESSEFMILYGTDQETFNRISRIFIEVHENGPIFYNKKLENIKSLLDYLEYMGFKVVSDVETSAGVHVFKLFNDQSDKILKENICD